MSYIWKVYVGKFYHPITLARKISNNSSRITAWHSRPSVICPPPLPSPTVTPDVLLRRIPYLPPFTSGLLSILPCPHLGFLCTPPSLLPSLPVLQCHPFLVKFKNHFTLDPSLPTHIQLRLPPLKFLNTEGMSLSSHIPHINHLL